MEVNHSPQSGSSSITCDTNYHSVVLSDTTSTTRNNGTNKFQYLLELLLPRCIPTPSSSCVPSCTTLAFWCIGILNNTPYVIMLAAAKSISEGGTALVFIASILPGLFLKLTAPYWFDRVSYHTRMAAASILMASSFLLVGIFSHVPVQNGEDELEDDGINNQQQQQQHGDNQFSMSIAMQLLGVALASLQGSLGEASMLALAGKVDSIRSSSSSTEDFSHEKSNNVSITAFSSGTGIAGMLGFAYVVLFTRVLGISLSNSLTIATVTFPLAFYLVYLKNLRDYSTLPSPVQDQCELVDHHHEHEHEHEHEHWNEEDHAQMNNNYRNGEFTHMCPNPEGNFSDQYPTVQLSSSMTLKDRFNFTLSLWPYMIPLFVVYYAEYALQSGIWTSIGFPVYDKEARDKFYIASNWVYQIGVFVSRSSGSLFTASMRTLWLMPFLQCINVVVFYCVAKFQFWYNYSLLFLCFYVGLLGGSVYVNGYIRINHDLPKSRRELALSTASVADSFGILVSDITGLFIQSCLYSDNDISGAIVQCPIHR